MEASGEPVDGEANVGEAEEGAADQDQEPCERTSAEAKNMPRALRRIQALWGCTFG